MKILRCSHCGNIVAFVDEKQPTIICCGEPMTQLKANTTDAAREKHVPVIRTEGEVVTVSVGSVPHPMTDDHFIAWILLETEQGRQRKSLTSGEKPEARFALVKGDKVVAAYAYCNKHGLWKA